MDFGEDLGLLLLNIALRLLLVGVVLIIGRGLAGLSRRWLTRSLEKTSLTPSLITLIVTLTYYSILLITVMLMLVTVGVPGSAIVGVAGILVVVLAISLQQSLGDLAATINFLLFKPLEMGDFVETSGVMGVVQEIQMFSTVIVSPQHKTHVLPNSLIQKSGIANYSKIGTIRADLSFRISYESDSERAKQVLLEVLDSDARVLREPAAQVFVGRLADSHVEITAWPFVQIADYLEFCRDVTERVRQNLDQGGVVIPYSQLVVHVKGDASGQVMKTGPASGSQGEFPA